MKNHMYSPGTHTLKRTIISHVVVAVIIAALTLLLDWYVLRYHISLPAFMQGSVDQARSLLSTLAGAMLTVTIFLYSTTIVVLTTYSAQFTPRVIENFINNRSIRRVFGVFIGGTIYCILILIFIRQSGSDNAYLLSGVGMGYTLVGIASFIAFIVWVSSAVQVQNLLARLAQEATQVVDKFVASRGDTVRTNEYDVREYRQSYDVLAIANGFFEQNDIASIRALLHRKEYTIVLYPRMGDFVSTNQRIASLYYNDIKLTRDIQDGLSQALLLAERRYTDNDYRFAIQKIVEVALKALSASINDPNTAIYCIRYLGVLAGRLARIDGKYAIITLERKEGATAQIVDQDFVFEKDLQDIFLQIIHYAKEDLSVVMSILQALRTAFLVSTVANRMHIQALAEYTFTTVNQYFTNPVEREFLQVEMEHFG